jgi:hypothetical protein
MGTICQRGGLYPEAMIIFNKTMYGKDHRTDIQKPDKKRIDHTEKGKEHQQGQ